MRETILHGTNFSFVDVANVDFTNASVEHAVFVSPTSTGLTEDQLYSTASYKAKDLTGITLAADHLFIGPNNLSRWGFAGQRLVNASFWSSDVRGADFSGADLRNANLFASGLDEAVFDSTTVYNQWTKFPFEFDPVAAGLRFLESPPGDLDADNELTSHDVDLLTEWIRWTEAFYHPRMYRTNLDHMFDLATNSLLGDPVVDADDLHMWIKELKHTWFGDANLDGEFDSGDLVAVFGAGEYEDTVSENSGWIDGDWDGDGDFTSGDLVVAFTDGGYEQGPRATNAVPEPTSLAMLAIGLIGIAVRRRCVVS